MIEEQKIKVEPEQANVVARLRPNPKAELGKTEQERVRAEESAATAREVVEYTTRIIAKIRRNILMPRNIPSNVIAEFEVTLMPDGTVLNSKLVKPSGITAYDRVVKRAIINAQPLPVPTDMALFNKFRELRLKFRPVKER
jgi:colicin import membrane protein